MKIIEPVTITEAVLTSSNVPESEYAPWSGGSYSVGGRCLKNHRIYEALVAHNNIDPTGTPTVPPTWLDCGMDNRWRMFDTKVSSQTSRSESIVVTLTPNAVVNAVAFLNVTAKSVRVQMNDPVDGSVYDRTLSLIDPGVNEFYDWFFAPVKQRQDAVLLDLPPYGTATLTVTISYPGGTAAIGHFVMGYLTELGQSCWGSQAGITDYSRKEQDDFGDWVIVERAYSKFVDLDVVIETENLDSTFQLLSQYRAKPLVWIGSDRLQSTLLFGFYRDLQLPLSGPSITQGTLHIEGLT